MNTIDRPTCSCNTSWRAGQSRSHCRFQTGHGMFGPDPDSDVVANHLAEAPPLSLKPGCVHTSGVTDAGWRWTVEPPYKCDTAHHQSGGRHCDPFFERSSRAFPVLCDIERIHPLVASDDAR